MAKKKGKGKKRGGERKRNFAAPAMIGTFAGGLLGKVVEKFLADTIRDFVLPEPPHREQHEKVHDAIGVRLDKGEQKFTGISSEMRHQPGYQVIETLRAEIGRLEAEMKQAAANLDFERAAAVRDTLKALRSRELGFTGLTAGR